MDVNINTIGINACVSFLFALVLGPDTRGLDMMFILMGSICTVSFFLFQIFVGLDRVIET